MKSRKSAPVRGVAWVLVALLAMAVMPLQLFAAVAVEGVVLSQSSCSLSARSSTTLQATVQPDNADNKGVVWNSSDTSIVTVDSNGKITGVRAGEATVTATTAEGGFTADCDVTVTAEVRVTGVRISSSKLNMTVGASSNLTATVEPGNASNKTVNWNSSDTSVATVDANGRVIARAAGTAAISAVTEDNGKIATCTVNVTAPTSTYTITVRAGTGGTVSGGGTYQKDSNATVTATPGSGYAFDGWYENNVRQTTSQSYTFKVTQNRTLEARFTLTSASSYTITAKAATGGTVTGGKTYTTGTTATVTATAKSGYTFEGWYEGSSRVSTNRSYSFTVNKNRTLEARFKTTITARAASGGTVSGGGTYKVGDTATLEANPKSGYKFQGWYESGSRVTTSRTLKFTVTKARTLEARFTSSSGTTYRITATAGTGGTVTGGGNYVKNELVTLEAFPKDDYEFDGWYEGSTHVSSDEIYTFKATKNRTLRAQFTDGTYTVTLKAGTGGSVDGDGSYDYRESVTVTASPKSGYTFEGWYDEDDERVSTNRSYTFRITRSRTLTARFTKGSGTTSGTTTGSTSHTKVVNAAKSAAAAARGSGKKSATVKLRNVGDITKDTCQAMRREAGMPVKLQADTITADGKAVDVRVTIDPSKVTKNLNLSASKTNARSQKTRNFFAKWFKNKTQVLALGQTGTYGCEVEIAVKLNFTGMDKNNLVFYGYDTSKNTYWRIEPSSHWIDKNGYLHIKTNSAGNLIVSSGKLVKK